MSSFFNGSMLKLSIFGQSHSAAIGMTLDGLPAGIPVDQECLQRFLNRRAPGKNPWSTPRMESDLPEFLSGLRDGMTCGAPLTAIIRNTNTRGKDYEALRLLPRPGHADYTAHVRYGGHQDYNGGGHFSGRLTAPLCTAGGILLQFLEMEKITVSARILSIAGIEDNTPFRTPVDQKIFPTVSDEKGKEMQTVIAAAQEDGDSVGGVIECIIRGVPAGIGAPMFDGVENRIAQLVFSVPAVKGIEFGAGFRAPLMRGSEHNDAYCVSEGEIHTSTNHAGGILGGISNGEDIVFRVAVKPTPSISRAQQSVNLETMQPEKLYIKGRHDPCIVPRAVPVIEAVAALALTDLYLGGRQDGFNRIQKQAGQN